MFTLKQENTDSGKVRMINMIEPAIAINSIASEWELAVTENGNIYI